MAFWREDIVDDVAVEPFDLESSVRVLAEDLPYALLLIVVVRRYLNDLHPLARLDCFKKSRFILTSDAMDLFRISLLYKGEDVAIHLRCRVLRLQFEELDEVQNQVELGG